MKKILFCLVIAISSCIVSQGFAAQSSADVPVSNELKLSVLGKIREGKAHSLPADEEYVIGHGDILTVTIYDEGDMAATKVTDEPKKGKKAFSGVRVMMDGRMSLKDIGDVEVVGLTLTELADYLKVLYSEIYDNPIITTTLVQSNSLRYTVMGKVVKPGIYPLDHPMTLVQVVARCGGFNEWAGREISVVRANLRPADKRIFRKNVLVFDYDDFISGEKINKNIFVRSGDIVVVK